MKQKIYIAFPDFSKYKTAPKDMSECTLEKCPKCEEKCWISERKKEIINEASAQNNDIFAACYICMKKELSLGLIENSTFIKI